MNAERLHIVGLTLREELSKRSVVDRLQSLVSACQAIGQQSNANTQQNLVSERESFYAAVNDTVSDSFTPAWRQILVEIGGEELFGRNLKERVQQILAENQMTPLVAFQKLQEIAKALFAEVVRSRVARKHYLKQLHLADPVDSVKQKFMDLFVPALNAKSKIFRYRDLNEFAEVNTRT